MSNNLENENVTEKLEVSVIEILSFLKKYLLVTIGFAFICGVLGVIMSFGISKKYTANTILLPEYKMAGGSSFFSMAFGGGSTGFDGAEKLAPDLYPNILSAIPFGLYLLEQPIVDKDGIKYNSYKEYLLRDTINVSWRSRILSFLKSPKNDKNESSQDIMLTDKDILNLDSRELGLARAAFSAIVCDVDVKRGTIIISAELPDPFVSAEIVERSKKYLIDYVEDYRSSKLIQQSTFLGERVAEAKKNMKNAEYALQAYRDRNRDAYLNISRIQEQQLQSEFMLTQSIYNDLIQRLEQSKIKEKEDKPVFKVLEPTLVPLGKSAPNRKLIGVVFAVIGGFFALIYIIFKKEKLHQKLM